MSRNVLFIHGSPSAASRSALLADAVASLVREAGLQPQIWSLRDFAAPDLLYARTTAASVTPFLEAAKKAVAVVLATPVYKATYTGALKAIVDLVPPEALGGRPALGIATARIQAHAGGVDHAFQALFGFFQARPLDTLFVLDGDLQVEAGKVTLSSSAEARVQASARSLVAAIEERPAISERA